VGQFQFGFLFFGDTGAECLYLVGSRALMPPNSYLAISLSAVWLDGDNLSASQGLSHSHLLSWGKPQVPERRCPQVSWCSWLIGWLAPVSIYYSILSVVKWGCGVLGIIGACTVCKATYALAVRA
jgi:hypothetical protein